MNQKVKTIWKRNFYGLCSFLGIKEYHYKYLKYKKEAELFNYKNMNFVLKELNEIKRILVLREIAPDLLPKFKKDLEFDTSKSGSMFPNYSYTSMAYNWGMSDSFLKESILLKLAEFNNSQNLFKARDFVPPIIDMITKISVKEQSLKAEMYLALIRYISHPNYYDLMAKVFESALEKLNDICIIPELALRLISFYLLKDNEEKALDLLKKYVKKHGKLDLIRFYPVAHLAYKNGIKNKKIAQASFIFENFVSSMNNNVFENYIKGKKVAIVGNGPQELGTNNGEKIDSYEEVIRFNDFSMSKSFHKDYGKKATVWSKNSFSSKVIRSDVNIHIFRINPYLATMDNKIKEYMKNLKLGKKLIWFPDELFAEISEKLGVATPTGGFEMVYWVKKINPQFSMNDCYGFSFKCDGVTGLERYYKNQTITGGHSFDTETRALRELLK